MIIRLAALGQDAAICLREQPDPSLPQHRHIPLPALTPAPALTGPDIPAGDNSQLPEAPGSKLLRRTP